MAKQLFYSNNFSINWDAKKNPGEVQRESASKRSMKTQTNKAKWMPKPTPKNPGEVQRNYASKQSMKTQTNKAKWSKGFIKNPSGVSIHGPSYKSGNSTIGKLKKLGGSSLKF